MNTIINIPLRLLHAHPGNPRKELVRDRLKAERISYVDKGKKSRMDREDWERFTEGYTFPTAGPESAGGGTSKTPSPTDADREAPGAPVENGKLKMENGGVAARRIEEDGTAASGLAALRRDESAVRGGGQRSGRPTEGSGGAVQVRPAPEPIPEVLQSLRVELSGRLWDVFDRLQALAGFVGDIPILVAITVDEDAG